MPGELEKFICDQATYRVQPPVTAIGVAATVPEPTSGGFG